MNVQSVLAPYTNKFVEDPKKDALQSVCQAIFKSLLRVDSVQSTEPRHYRHFRGILVTIGEDRARSSANECGNGEGKRVPISYSGKASL